VVAGGERPLRGGRPATSELRALRRLKAEVVKAAVWELPEASALTTAYQLWRKVGGMRLRKAGLWRSCTEGFQVEAWARWPSDWCARRVGQASGLALVEELPDWMAEEVANGRIGAHAAAKLPGAVDARKRRGRPRAGGKDSGAWADEPAVGELYACYRAQAWPVRRKIVEDPHCS